MKIKKYNESNISKNDLDDFIEDFMEVFTKLDEGNIGNYFCNSTEKYITLYFEFMVITEQELIEMKKVVDYIKKFDSYSESFIYGKHVDAELDVASYEIEFKLSVYDNIVKDLKMKKNSKKFKL